MGICRLFESDDVRVPIVWAKPMLKLLVDSDAAPEPQVQESELFTNANDSAGSLSATHTKRKLKLYTLSSKNP